MQRPFFFLQAEIPEPIESIFEAKSALKRNNIRNLTANTFDRLHAGRFEDRLSPKVCRPIPRGVPGDTLPAAGQLVPEEEQDVRSSRI